MNRSLQQELENFLNSIDTMTLLESLPDSEQLESQHLLSVFKNEAKVALNLIHDDLDFNIKILEVGAGLCLFSIFLRQNGYKVTALEPLEGGFGFFEAMKQSILQAYSAAGLKVLEKAAEQLDPEQDGKFDLIFSSNVVEHIAELDSAFLGMCSVLKDDGKMIHGCPNYLVPYEPHFGLPVIGWFPKLTEILWRRRIEEKSEIWKSLNFVTYFKIKKVARMMGCSVKFQSHLTYDAFDRLRKDAEFRLRHRNTMVGKCLRLLEISGTLKLTKLLPVWLSTPMVFTLTKKNDLKSTLEHE